MTRDSLAKPPEIQMIDGRPVRFRDVVVQRIRMGDVEDPDLFVAEPIYHWQQSEEGQWIMEHAVETPFWTRHVDPAYLGHEYVIQARLSEQNETFWRLKWGST